MGGAAAPARAARADLPWQGGCGLVPLCVGDRAAVSFSVWQVATPGHFAIPFVPGLAVPGLADICIGVVYYFAALALALQRDKWIGLRAFPLLAAFHCSCFAILPSWLVSRSRRRWRCPPPFAWRPGEPCCTRRNSPPAPGPRRPHFWRWSFTAHADWAIWQWLFRGPWNRGRIPIMKSTWLRPTACRCGRPMSITSVCL